MRFCIDFSDNDDAIDAESSTGWIFDSLSFVFFLSNVMQQEMQIAGRSAARNRDEWHHYPFFDGKQQAEATRCWSKHAGATTKIIVPLCNRSSRSHKF